MKTLNETTTNFLAGKINHCGDYAGKYAQEAHDIVMQGEEFQYGYDGWSDIMYFPKTGEVIAILAKGELTSNSECYYVYVDEKDCPAAFRDMYEKEF